MMLGFELVSEPGMGAVLDSETMSNRWGIACACCKAEGFCKSSLAKSVIWYMQRNLVVTKPNQLGSPMGFQSDQVCLVWTEIAPPIGECLWGAARDGINH